MDTASKARTLVRLRLNLRWTEARLLTAVTIGLLLVTSLPCAYGYLSCPEDKWFSGVVYNVHDTAQYLSWMREAGTSLLTDNKLTAEPNARIFINLHWWILGRLAHMFGLTLPQGYQLFRVLAVPLLALATYAFCATLFSSRRQRWCAFLLSTFTSGLGWIWVVTKYTTGQFNFPHDVYTTPGNAFWMMIASPHLTFAAALTLGVLLLALLSVRKQRLDYALGSGALALFLGMGHIYDLVTIWTVLALFGLLLTLRDGWTRKTFLSLASVVFISAPAAVYWAWVSSDAHPAWQQALAQYDNLGAFTPAPPHLLVLLGIAFLLALATFDGLVPLKRHADGLLLIKCWFIIVPFLVYLPVRFQIMLLTAYNVPVGVLATVGLFDHIMPWLRERLPGSQLSRWVTERRLRQVLPVMLLVAVSLTNLYLLAWRVYDLSRHDHPFYLDRDETAALQWLEEHTAPDEVMLSSLVVGHFIPGLTGDRAFLGSGVMTLDFHRKQAMVEAFFDPATSDSERQALIRTYGIRHVFQGSAEREMGSYDPESLTCLTAAYRNRSVTVFVVDNDCSQMGD